MKSYYGRTSVLGNGREGIPTMKLPSKYLRKTIYFPKEIPSEIEITYLTYTEMM